MKNKKIGYLHQKYWHPKEYRDLMHIPALNDLISKYTAIASQTEQPNWYVKGVGLYFTFEDEAYAMYPGDIHTSAEIFELLENGFAEDLYSIGAYDLYCAGMLD